ncbi:MAG: DUF402 domain-containing protein [Chloroflexota bacterium]
MQILEIKNTLDGRRKEFPCDLCWREADHAVILYQLKRDVVLDGILMPAGTLSFGHYWRDRGFNVYHWLYASGQTAAYYYNLADRTTIGEGTVEWRDLTVDVMVTPDGSVRVLDEDELPPDLDPALRKAIDATVAYLREHHVETEAQIERESRRCLAARGLADRSQA